MMESSIAIVRSSTTNGKKIKRTKSTGDSLLWLQVLRYGNPNPSVGVHAGSPSPVTMRRPRSAGTYNPYQCTHRNASFSTTPRTNGSTTAERTTRLRSTLDMPGQRVTRTRTSSPTTTRQSLKSWGSLESVTHVQRPGWDSNTSLESQGSGESFGNHTKSSVVVQLAQRSNGGSVKAVLSKLQGLTAGRESPAPDRNQGTANMLVDLTLPPPSQDLALLAHCAGVDEYYQVIISKYNGIPTIIKMMDMYSQHLDIQMHGLTALACLTDKASIHLHGGVRVCVRAMIAFSDDMELQSAGFHMLKMQASALAKEGHDVLRSLRTVLERVRQKYLTQHGKDGFVFVERFLDTYHVQAEGELVRSNVPTS
jgi:hypothetical protein